MSLVKKYENKVHFWKIRAFIFSVKYSDAFMENFISLRKHNLVPATEWAQDNESQKNWLPPMCGIITNLAILKLHLKKYLRWHIKILIRISEEIAKCIEFPLRKSSHIYIYYSRSFKYKIRRQFTESLLTRGRKRLQSFDADPTSHLKLLSRIIRPWNDSQTKLLAPPPPFISPLTECTYPWNVGERIVEV